MTHIDPFAPADSPQHPANWDRDANQRVEDTLANLYQWRRDHFAMVSEAGQDVAPEELEDRQVRYQYLLDEYGTPHEQDNDPFVPQPVLLRRSVWHDLQDTEIDRWKQLFEWHSVEDERDPAWVDKPMPTLDELEARARVFEASNDVSELQSYPRREEEASTAEPDATGSEPSASSEPLEVPKSTALKEEWVEYALAVERAKGVELSEEDAERIGKMTVADLKATYKPQGE